MRLRFGVVYMVNKASESSIIGLQGSLQLGKNLASLQPDMRLEIILAILITLIIIPLIFLRKSQPIITLGNPKKHHNGKYPSNPKPGSLLILSTQQPYETYHCNSLDEH